MYLSESTPDCLGSVSTLVATAAQQWANGIGGLRQCQVCSAMGRATQLVVDPPSESAQDT